MAIPDWIRASLYRADNWCVELDLVRRSHASEPPTTESRQRTVDLARVTEDVDPDLGRALALYLAAWRAGHAASRARVLLLARELRAYVTLAELALADHQASADPACLLAVGRALYDGGLQERAMETFMRASAQAPATGCLDARTLIALSRYEDVDPARVVADCMTQADQAGDGAAAIYVQAARVARAANLDALYATVVTTAARRCPADEEIARLAEDRVLEHGSADEVLAHYRVRFEATRGEAAWVACVRAAATQLVMHNLHPGLGLRLLRRSLEHAYAARLAGVPRHLAAWELLVSHARSSRSTAALAPLIADALRAPLSEEDAIYLSRLGLEITWRDLRDPVAAQPFAIGLLARVPGHPLAAAFVAEYPPPPPEPEPSATTLPTITFKIPVVKPAPPPAAKPVTVPTATPAPLPVERAPRMIVPVDVVVELPTGSFFSTVLRDLSTSGAFVLTKRKLEVGTVVSLEVTLPTSSNLTQTRYTTEARIARRTELGWGLAFTAPPPELVAAIATLTG